MYNHGGDHYGEGLTMISSKASVARSSAVFDRDVPSVAWSHVLARHGRSFWLASRFLPARVRTDTTILYAFFRTLDDIADDRTVDPLTARRVLHAWQKWIRDGFQGLPPEPRLGRSVVRLYHRYALTSSYLIDLIDGLIADLEPRRIRTRAELLHYCYQVAGTVGLTLAPVLGVHCQQGREAAYMLGIAMQLTNIARDLGEDLRRDRLYVPTEDCHRFGLDEQELLARAKGFAPPCHRVRELVHLLVTRARLFYRRAAIGYPCLPNDVRFGIVAAAELYASILVAIERNGFDTLRVRAVAGTDDKVLALLRAWSLARRTAGKGTR